MTRPPRFPKSLGTARAQVLAILLASEDMTGRESIFPYGKIGLATVVRALIRKYRWPIERQDFPSNTADGRSTWATVYCLPEEVIAAAYEAGARDWLDRMKAVRLSNAGLGPPISGDATVRNGAQHPED